MQEGAIQRSEPKAGAVRLGTNLVAMPLRLRCFPLVIDQLFSRKGQGANDCQIFCRG